MFKVLIVDDEELIRKGLTKILQRSCEEFLVIGEASNGVEALELIKKDLPDIVISDVRMPFMDGIALMNSLEVSYPSIKKIILSGFSEFNYVRDSMKSGALDYLLKPVDDEELINLLKRIAKDINSDSEKKLKELNLRIQLNESLPLLGEVFIRELVSGKIFSKNELENKLKYFNINVTTCKYCIIIISIDNFQLLQVKLGAEDAKLKAFIVRNISEEIVSNHTTFFSCMDNFNLILAVSIPESESFGINKLMSEIYDNVLKFSGTRVTICAGKAAETISALNSSYVSALEILKYRFYNKRPGIITSDDISGFLKAGFNKEILNSCMEKFVVRLKNCIEIANHKLVAEIIDEYCLMLTEMKTDPSEAIKSFMEICIKIQMSVPEFDKSISELYGFEYSFIKQMEIYDTLDEIRKYTIEVFEKVVENLEDVRKRKDKKLVEIVKSYIQKHYNEDVTLNKIVEITYLSSSYVCDLFKSQAGENIIDYLTRVRIEKAKSLLKDLKIKTYEVGQMVGYEDATYFSKVFKKVVGVSPTEYRNMVE